MIVEGRNIVDSSDSNSRLVALGDQNTSENDKGHNSVYSEDGDPVGIFHILLRII